MREDDILLSIVNKELDKDVICMATEKAFLGRLNLSKCSSNSLIQSTNLSGYLVFELTKHYLESALSRLNSICPANLCLERSVISPLVEPAAQVVDENYFTATDDALVEKTGPDSAFQLEQTKSTYQCDSEAQLPSEDSKDGSQIITSSGKAESDTYLDGNAVSCIEGTFKPAKPPVNKIVVVIPSIHKAFCNQPVLQCDSFTTQPVSLVANIGNYTLKPCSSGFEHTLSEESFRCVRDKAADVLEHIQGESVGEYFEDQAIGTETNGNEEWFVGREFLSGDVHGESFCDVSLSDSGNQDQAYGIPFNPGSKFNGAPGEASFSGCMSVNENTSILNSEGHSSSISGDIQQVPCGHSDELSDGIFVTESRNERFTCASVKDPATDTLDSSTDVITGMCYSIPESSSNSNGRPTTWKTVEGFEEYRSVSMVEKSKEDNLKSFAKSSVAVETCGTPEQGGTTNVCSTGDGGRTKTLPLPLPVEDLLHRVKHDHLSYVKSTKISSSKTTHSVLQKTEWRLEALLKCYLCKIVHPTHKKLLKHIKKKHLKTGPVICEVCKKEMKTPQVFHNHQLIHSSKRPYYCRICKKRFTTPMNLNSHKKSHYKPVKSFTCVTCGLVLSKQSEMTRHKQTHRKSQTVGNGPLECGVCGKCVSSRQSLETHMRGHTGEKPYACSICNKAFNYRNSLKTHIWTHHHASNRPYSCNKCKKTFVLPCKLREHERFHTGEKPYTCETCGKSFVLPYQLTRHVSTHVDGKPFACDVCSKRFRLPYKLKRHKATHTGEKPFMCDRCGKVFKDVSGLKYHARSKRACTPSAATEKNVNQCKETVCDETSQSSLSSQDVVSLPAKPWNCDVCGKTFRSKTTLTRHIRTHAKS